MSLKTILVQYDDGPSGAKRVEAAAELARMHDAHLTGVVLDIMPRLPAYLDVQMTAAVVEAMETDAHDATERTVAALRTLLGRQDCRSDCRIARCADWNVGRTLSLHARYADLLVLGQPFPTEPAVVDAGAIGQILISSGRPVLILPYIATGTSLGGRTVVAWDAGREAVRAVSDSMPLLAHAAGTTVLTVNPGDVPGAHGDMPGADVALHLARHGITVDVAAIESREIEVADAVLNWIADNGADLLVMGAYAHSRARELVFGGTTRSILECMTVPVLMSH